MADPARGTFALAAGIAAVLLARPLWEPRPAAGVLVEVRGDVATPSWHRLDDPHLSAAVAAAGWDGALAADPVLADGDLVRVGAAIEVTTGRGAPVAARPLDVDGATVDDLAAIPDVGPELALAIVADRDANGAFGSVHRLIRVDGVSPRVVAAIARYTAPEGYAPIDVDRASAADLATLPGIGPALAARIVADRAANGPFGTPAGLVRVPGVGERTLVAIRPYVAGAP